MNALFRFVAVGVLNTGWGYLLIFGFMYFLSWPPEASNAAGYAIAFVTSYILHRVYTFESRNRVAGEFGRYASVFACAFLMNFVSLYVMVRHLGWNAYLSQVLAGVVYVLLSFLLNKNLVFARIRASD